MAGHKQRDERWEELEARVQEELDKARRRALLADSFDEMEEIVDEIGRIVQQEMLAAMAEQREVEGRQRCRMCGEQMHRRGKKERKMKTSKGEVRIERVRWVCPECEEGLFPPG
jgi:hypothetical protein